MNKAILIGRLGKDPEVRSADSGKKIASFSIATSERWRDQNGDRQERTEWHRCVAFGRAAEVAGEYLQKGSQVCIDGKIQTRKWFTETGDTRYTTEVIVGRLEMLGSRQQSQAKETSGDQGYHEASGRTDRPPEPKPPEDPPQDVPFDDDIPF